MRTKSTWPIGYALKECDSIDSTNEDARRMALAGERGPIWIVAEQQTAGRGRRGRTFHSPRGNLFASLMLRPSKPAGECAQLSFVAAIAVADMIANYALSAEIRVKWPNDVLANGNKIAGILLESASGSGNDPLWLAIGIGVNIARHPSDTELPATSLAVLVPETPSPRGALLDLAVAFAKWYDLWRIEGFSPIRDAWLARATGLGTRIRARLHNEEVRGVFEGIDSFGALLLREDASRVRTISSADVFFSH